MFIKLRGSTVNANEIVRILSTDNSVRFKCRNGNEEIACPGIGEQVHEAIDKELAKKTTVFIDVNAIIATLTPAPETEPEPKPDPEPEPESETEASPETEE